MTKTISTIHEHDIAKLFVKHGFTGSRVQPGSGNKDHNPNDVRTTVQFMIECKATTKNQMTFHISWIERVMDKASQFLDRGAVAIRFKKPGYNKPLDYFIVEAGTFMNLLECERQLGKCKCS